MVTEKLFPNVIDSFTSQHGRGSRPKTRDSRKTTYTKKHHTLDLSFMAGLFQDAPPGEEVSSQSRTKLKNCSPSYRAAMGPRNLEGFWDPNELFWI